MAEIISHSVNENDLKTFNKFPPSSHCRIIDFDKHHISNGIVPNTYFLHVSGMKPWINLIVSLEPVIYIRRPEYWEIQVVACMNGIGLPAVTPYQVTRDISNFIGTKGIAIVSASKPPLKIDIP